MLGNANLLADGNLLTRNAPRHVQHLKIAHLVAGEENESDSGVEEFLKRDEINSHGGCVQDINPV